MHLGKQHISNTLNSALCQRHTQPFCQSRFKLKLNYMLLYLTSFFLKLFMLSSSVCVLHCIFRCARFQTTVQYIDINGIASYHIAYKKYIDISYKLDKPPSPSPVVVIHFHALFILLYKHTQPSGNYPKKCRVC